MKINNIQNDFFKDTHENIVDEEKNLREDINKKKLMEETVDKNIEALKELGK